MILETWGRAGCGKTTLAVNLALTLAFRSQLVGILSANLQYGQLQTLFGQTIQREHGTFRAIADGSVREHFSKSGLNENIFLLAVPNEYTGLDYETVTQSQAEQLIEQSAACFDVLIIDGSEDIGNPISSVGLVKADKILLLHRPSPAARAWLNAKKALLPLMRISDKLVHILNAPDQNCEPSEYLSGIKPTAELPFVPEAPAMENMGVPLFGSDTRLAKGYRGGLAKLLKEVAPLE